MNIAQVPFWLSIAFLLAIPAPIFMMARLAKRAAGRNVGYKVAGFYLIYFLGVALACLKGGFKEASLPPRIVVMTTFPLLLFLMGFVFNSRWYKGILKNTLLSDWVALHIFRVLGSFFILLYVYGHLPKPFALIAGCGDILTAISSLYVAKMVQKNHPHAKKVVLGWNTFGLLDILLTSSMAIWFTKMNMETGSLGVDVLAQFPFCFIPAFAPATIIFLHLSVYRKVFVKKYQ